MTMEKGHHFVLSEKKYRIAIEEMKWDTIMQPLRMPPHPPRKKGREERRKK